jgi:hypothetical protein
MSYLPATVLRMFYLLALVLVQTMGAWTAVTAWICRPGRER